MIPTNGYLADLFILVYFGNR